MGLIDRTYLILRVVFFGSCKVPVPLGGLRRVGVVVGGNCIGCDGGTYIGLTVGLMYGPICSGVSMGMPLRSVGRCHVGSCTRSFRGDGVEVPLIMSTRAFARYTMILIQGSPLRFLLRDLSQSRPLL
jgi:hypothetical protein